MKPFSRFASPLGLSVGLSVAFSVVLSVSLTACKKEPLAELEKAMHNKNPSFITAPQCEDSKRISKNSRYQNPVFTEDFKPHPGDPCYTQKPMCGTRLDWFMDSDCPFDASDPRYAGIKDLNKCVWNVWQGYNFWAATSKQITFDASAIEVRDGRLILKMLPNPNYDASKGGCGDTSSNLYALNYYNVNCPVISGGLDSKFIDNNMHKGRNALYGRIEMKARYVATSAVGGYSALWMWPNQIGKGYPHNPTSASLLTNQNGDQEPTMTGEIDINEANFNGPHDLLFQTYHNWNHGTKGSASIAKTTQPIDMSVDHVYGVEWSPTAITYYYDDCVTKVINVGDISTGDGPNTGLKMKISDVASFMILSIGAGWTSFDASARDQFIVSEVQIFE